MRTAVRLSLIAALAMMLSACKGDAGADGTSCTVTDNGDGTVTISCEDGTEVTVDDGADGDSCTVTDNGDGTNTITCGDTSVTVSDGTNCTVVDNGDGTKTITCGDGSVVITDGADGENGLNGENGESGGGVEIWRKHGSDFLRGEELEADNKYLVNATITDVDVDTETYVTVFFTVTTLGANPVPVTDVQAQTSVGLTIAQLVPGTTAEPISYWLPYIYRTQTVSGDTYPNPAGTTAYQATSESSTSSTMPGVLSNLGNGNYSYRSFTQLDNVTSPVAVTYEPTRTHRVSIMMGGGSGPTATADYDFRPDGGTVTERRDLVLTSTCKNCHGDEFHGHGGNRITVANCATCHVPSNWDPHGGETVDLKVMIHKIHAGGELPTVRGPDGNPWATADNGMYAIWGYQNTKHEWWKVGFPAVIENCTACHQGDPAQVPQVDNWKTKPSRAACGSCHDDIDFTETVQTDPSYHLGGSQTDDASCTVCHAPTKSVPIDVAHDWTVDHTWANGSATDPRNQPEFTAELTMSAPANGQYYEGNEAPVVTIVLKRNGTPIADHRIAEGPAESCTPTSCPADLDGLYATTNLFVNGPRARRMPALTTAARAEIFSLTGGPWNLSAAGASLVVKVDTGETLTKDDDWGTQVPGLITVPVTAATGADLGAVTLTEAVNWLNGNPAFAARAIAYSQNGKLGIRSRNLGRVHAIQLQASEMATQAFGGDLLPRSPPGFYTNNILSQRTDPAKNDPKVTRTVENITYQLDPVTDVAAGTYVVLLELSQKGRKNATEYKTPTVAKLAFNVKTGTAEPQVAGNCDSCHQNGQGKGFVLDWSRHNKIFDDTAVDQCGACHDYQPQMVPGQVGFPTNGAWTGGKPISKRVHAVHFGSSLNYPLGTVDYSNGDPVTGRNWDITFPQDVRNCETCHPDGDSSGTWMTEPARLPCMGCHDADAAVTHMKLNTLDPTPADPWSGDEKESCKACHQ